MDYTRMRAAALQGDEEDAVTVDTRALIDKVLARYSGEWTTLRELIQNAADAQATRVSVKFETIPSTRVPLPPNPSPSELLKHTLTHHTLRRLVVSNNGQPFTGTDWARLKRIADGNPDESKVGAFGVGFYSVFADCEEPFISSGNEAMAFYWKGNALFTKKSTLPANQSSSDTTLVLDYRTTTTPVPNILSVAQFLGTSLTFVALQKMEFWVDDWKLLDLHKKASPSVSVALPRDLETRTQDGIMKLVSAERVNTQIDASYMAALGWKRQGQAGSGFEKSQEPTAEAPLIKSFFAKFASAATQGIQKVKAQADEAAAQAAIAEDITKRSASTIFLRVTSASVKTTVTPQFATELERATKKAPPKVAKLAILSSSYTGQQSADDSKAVDIFATVMPSKKPGGRIFIGFPTMQTTGAGLHISAPSVIPTVEREAIDLNARWVRSWNVEMLRAAGMLTRLSYYDDMNDLGRRVRSSIPAGGQLTEKEVARHLPEALHLLKTYTFGDSTPNSQVGEHINKSFWTAFNSAVVEVYSTRGVLPTAKVRIRSPEVAKFINGLPMVPEELEDTPFVAKLREYGLLTTVTLQDIRQELSSKAMNKEQLTAFIKWAAKSSSEGKLRHNEVQGLLGAAIGMAGDNADQGEIIALSAIRHFVVASKIPANLPVPPDTIPFSLTSHCSAAELQALGWTPLDMHPWLQFLVSSTGQQSDQYNMLKSTGFATQVLGILSKAWDSTSQLNKDLITELLQSHAIMPTKVGMRKPQDAFFPSVKIFDDLPVIQGCNHVKDKFLSAIGVRKTLDLETIFSRLLSGAPSEGKKPWSHVELIRYLASVADDIPQGDMKKFYEARMCPAEAGPPGQEFVQGSVTLYRVTDLYEPQDSLRELGLPLLQWPNPTGRLALQGAELRFLTALGLKKFPTPMQLVDMMSGPNGDLQQKAMTYFLSKYNQNNYRSFDLSASTKSFLPVEGQKGLVRPGQCFTDEAAAVLGYRLLRKDLHTDAARLGVSASPPIRDCVKRLLHQPPGNAEHAKELFSYFSRRTHELNTESLRVLRGSPFVPLIDAKGAQAVKHVSPSMCYLGTSSTYANIFDFVDFGPESYTFLSKCGAKQEPTKVELATRACEEPARLLDILDAEKYQGLLRVLANDISELRRHQSLWNTMKRVPFLLGCQLVSSDAAVTDDNDDEPAFLKRYILGSASQITIPDNFIAQRIFQQHLLCPPEDEALEKFYESLGAKLLTQIVQEDLKIGSVVHKEDLALQYRKHLVERSRIFLSEYSRDRKENIRHDAKWLNKNLRVIMVQTISLRRKLPNHPQTDVEKRSAAGLMERDGCTLYISMHNQQPDMYHVAQALCKILLKKENLQTCVFFEPFLTLGLVGLRNRGYNVQRILRAKEQEARIAEEDRQRAVREEQDQRRAREIEEAQHAAELERLAATGGAPPTPREPQPMPGAFDNEEMMQPLEGKKHKGFFSNWKNRLGLDYKDDEPSGGGSSEGIDSSSGAGPSHPPLPGPKMPEGAGKVTDPSVLNNHLANAVRSTRPYGSTEVADRPEVKDVAEQSTYCDRSGGNNVQFVMESSTGMKIFIDQALPKEETVKFLSANGGVINMFAGLLCEAAAVYDLQRKALHIFYDEEGGTIAFNKGGSIFANLRFFVALHAGKLQSADPVTLRSARADALSYWWVVLAHELAHNLVDLHNSEHSFYTESFIQQYHATFVAQLSNPGGAAPIGTGSSGAMVPVTQTRSSSLHGARPMRAGATTTTTANQQQSDATSLPPPPPYSAAATDPRQTPEWRN